MVNPGDRVTDTLTKVCGVATARAVYLTGNVRIQVQAAAICDGAPAGEFWIDEARLVVDDKSTRVQCGFVQVGADPC